MERTDLHWLALQLYRRLGTRELPTVREQGLSLWGYEVLTLLVDAPVRGQLELVDALELDKTKVMRIVDELEAAGHVTREQVSGDRRRRAVTITPGGRRAWRHTRRALAAIEDDLYARLPVEARDATRNGLLRLVEVLSAD
ncbi:hypothetical protein GCM10022243_42800 [Saccharothrix violaceirubra]|uniref:DNA-binding MarR family transcriptional regulator n=1 Tax=Saccharothrix violaceirubra TaxID=413306 RepID=A0A7W7WWG5_9PSEU|nr:MarR family transcriptional regulator [Saccharothrix violaceirubra]MBB4965568.1 DNA-binding MarR family transcriptional regulator [Saccharothrix violaceirubra]